MVIGAMRDGGGPLATFVGMAPKKVYGIKVRENGVVVRDYCPALNLEGKATLYDRVTGTCLAVYGGDGFRAVDFDGPYVNYVQYRAYGDLHEAYAAASPGETIVVREDPGETISVTGRLDVAIETGGFGGIEVLSPDPLYRVFRRGTVFYIGDANDLTPRFDCDTAWDLFVPANVAAGFVYAVYVTEDLVNGPWRKIGEGLEMSDFEVDAPAGATSFFIKAVVRDGG